jgi:hypothetical protein
MSLARALNRAPDAKPRRSRGRVQLLAPLLFT